MDLTCGSGTLSRRGRAHGNQLRARLIRDQPRPRGWLQHDVTGVREESSLAEAQGRTEGRMPCADLWAGCIGNRAYRARKRTYSYRGYRGVRTSLALRGSPTTSPPSAASWFATCPTAIDSARREPRYLFYQALGDVQSIWMEQVTAYVLATPGNIKDLGSSRCSPPRPVQRRHRVQASRDSDSSGSRKANRQGTGLAENRAKKRRCSRTA